MFSPTNENMKVLFEVLLLIFLLIVVGLLGINKYFGVYVVTSGSMEPQVKMGSLVFTKVKSNYEVNDVVVFRSPDSKGFILHKIIRKDAEDFVTKGDANLAEDNFRIKREDVVGVLIFTLPVVGNILKFLISVPGIICFIFMPASFLVVIEVKNLIRLHSI